MSPVTSPSTSGRFVCLFFLVLVLQHVFSFIIPGQSRTRHLRYFSTSESIKSPSSTNQQQPPIRPRKLDKKQPVIAVVGRPNVGKSALVNRIAGTHSGGAIVADEPGITRDRTYRLAEFLGEKFWVVDTGGLVFDDDESAVFAKQIRQQAMIAMDESSAVIFVVDGQRGFTPVDLQIADFLRKYLQRIPVLVAVNKCESEKTGLTSAADFWQLGLGNPYAVSALHGMGTAELLEGMFEGIVTKKSAIEGFGTKVKRLQEAKSNMKHKGPLPWEDETDYKMRKWGIGDPAKRVLEDYESAISAFENLTSNDQAEEINVAIIGRPNVGKSSLLNSIFGDTRAIVSDIAGTTRDSIDAIMERPASADGRPATVYRFVDTAGIRRKGKVEYGPEFFMVNRALRAIRRADVVLLILDATSGVTEQDRILAEKISEDGRACVVVCNKWDAVVNKDSTTYDKAIQYVRQELPVVRWAPIVFLSAATGQRVGKLYSFIDEALQAHRKRMPTAILNQVLRDAVAWQAPPAKRNGASAKVYYCHQVSTAPPTIVVFCNDPDLLPNNYRRYLERKFRESLQGLEATPIRWVFRGKREREVERAGIGRTMNGAPGAGGTGTSFPFPHAD